MKKRQAKKFQFSKIAIAQFTSEKALKVKGGTVPTDPNMSNHPDEQNICWAAK
ncbi:hypothetical protein [Kordia jejudonensis]|uniref:hypothetical protein n=1 Tax=Kordia jejudonensis TaxID=1348245 RepID=UPI0012E028E4|nr:hypothetical protein [Kordia jejudonensis]